MKVQARFRVNQHIRFGNWYGATPPALQESFRLNGVKGEPFGSATPNANLEITIANPEAAKLFTEALESGRDIDVIFSLADPAAE